MCNGTSPHLLNLNVQHFPLTYPGKALGRAARLRTLWTTFGISSRNL